MEKSNLPFGVVIACCNGDLHYAQACWQSIRFFLGDIPVCFVVNGNPAGLGAVHNDPNVSFITKATTQDSWLQSTAYGLGHTKMVALWEAPFERYLYLDADTVVWGNVLGLLENNEYDVVVDKQKSYDDAAIDFWFFNTQKIETHFPEFDYRQARDKYACTGTYFMRRGALPLTLYKQTRQLQENDPSLFLFGEMGLWNFMVFYEEQHNGLKRQSLTYQVIPVDHTEEEMQREYSPAALGSGKELKSAVLHFCGKKAHIFTNSARVAAMNHFRLQYLMLREGLPLWKAVVRMAKEDVQWVFWPKAKKGWKKLLRILKGAVAKRK